jgi:class 3 adenylate cyclase
MERKMQAGYLLLADISGYTSFVAQTEIEHAGLALSYLLETIVEKLDDLLTISKLEGDAVFAYLGENNVQDCKSLLELIDQTYLAFRDRAQDLYDHATCPCRACKAIPTLDLKFILHHGEFVLQQVAGIRDLLGTDVNLIHRLLKNGVFEATGWKGYAIFTDQALEHMQCSKENYFRRCESYEHLGEVNIYCMDLHARYDEMKTS